MSSIAESVTCGLLSGILVTLMFINGRLASIEITLRELLDERKKK